MSFPGRKRQTRERVRSECSLGDTQKHWLGNGWLRIAHNCLTLVLTLHGRVHLAEATTVDDFPDLQIRLTGVDHDEVIVQVVVHLFEDEAVDIVVFQQRRVTSVNTEHLLHHLTDDTFDVLVIDGHTLKAVYLLDLIDQVFLYSTGAEDSQDVFRRNLTIRQRIACADKVILVDEEVLRERNQIGLRLCTVTARDDDFLRTTLTTTEADDTVDLGDLGGIIRRASFEELGHTRQTTRNISGLGRLTWIFTRT